MMTAGNTPGCGRWAGWSTWQEILFRSLKNIESFKYKQTCHWLIQGHQMLGMKSVTACNLLGWRQRLQRSGISALSWPDGSRKGRLYCREATSLLMEWRRVSDRCLWPCLTTKIPWQCTCSGSVSQSTGGLVWRRYKHSSGTIFRQWVFLP